MLLPLPLFRRRLLAWYDRHRRELPWRVPRDGAAAFPDPYHVLVSELMLQQTQVATVVPYFLRFLQKFPTLADLARADEQAVLRLWQGLGYYSRARNLQAAAKAVVERHGGTLPPDRDQLLALPGVGPYTAGAVASIAFGKRAPILDGNVARVLCRLDKIEGDPRHPATLARLWARAEEVLPGAGKPGRDRGATARASTARANGGGGRAGDFNSALMELGAIVCTPRSPQCLICPVRAHCEAFAAGAQGRIPAPRKARPTPLCRRWTLCVRRQSGGGAAEWLVEQRPPRGRWAGMWQFVTLDAGPATESPTESTTELAGDPGLPPAPTEAAVRSALSFATGGLTPLGSVAHALTHRRYHFEVFLCAATGGAEGQAADSPDTGRPRRWVRLDALSDYPLPRPHLKIVEILRALTEKPKG